MPEQSVPDQIREARRRAGRRLVVLDDDPTGSQSVHDVQIVLTPERSQIAAALAEPGSTCFVLTNSRSLTEPEAVALTEQITADVLAIEAELGAPIDILSRSDSTLRGHVLAEPAAVDRVRRATTGRGYEGVLFAPAFFEAGRVTEGDVHWVTTPEGRVPVGQTEFAADATFGYASSDLRDLVAELAEGTVPGGQVHSISLADIAAGPAQVAAVLEDVHDGAFVVVNGVSYDDYETVVLGLLQAQERGREFGYRTAPSFVRALAGITASDPLTSSEIWPEGHPGGHGLVVVGSHVGRTTEQLTHLQALHGLNEVELDVPRVVAGDEQHVNDVVAAVREGLGHGDVVLSTSRRLVTAQTRDESLQISAAVSLKLASIVSAALGARPAWVVAKGGITSHDVAVHGLGMRRAIVAGQLRPGIISLFRPVEADPRAIGVPYVVFPGNVGGPEDLAGVVRRLRPEGT
jgi:uncharacterized protein YgbK (DUF1537 family)